ncbi:hypothetical protein VTJ83DRAFT_2219 [Remersonia thermophila]|uniref:HMG box domain-containing protein n=1 Tax=Remersonia thermophila TaxID=72144 RepID=A0ABR4DI39_9PEZI
MARQSKAKAAAAAAAAAAAVEPVPQPVPQPIPVAPAPSVPLAVAPAPVTSLAFRQHPVIDVDQFIRVRNSVYQRLQTIQDLIKSFSQDYLRQTNLLIGEGTTLEDDGSLDRIAGVLTTLNPLPVAPPQPPVEEKKERKKRQHDPNAPKRPLTPYFLYMQTARPIIANDLGENVPKGAVQDEGQRRWGAMPPAEKLGWNQAYQYNLRLYNARVHSYKNGNPDAKNMTDEEARVYADTHNIPMPPLAHVEGATPADDSQAIAEQLQQSPAEEESTSKTPKKATGGRKRKSTAAATPAPAAEPEPPKSAAATPASPEVKKRKRASKAAEQIPVEEPKKSSRKKTKTG